jgi:hypothetical protein
MMVNNGKSSKKPHIITNNSSHALPDNVFSKAAHVIPSLRSRAGSERSEGSRLSIELDRSLRSG